jgi:uncharacterized protein (DUF2141 family)
MRRLAILAPLLVLSAAAPGGELEVRFEGLRSAKGVLHACLSRSEGHFPDCSRDPKALKSTVPATAGAVQFSGVTPGRYALTLFHDENTNQRLDMVLGIPREGFGFSRNPRVRFGAPKFNQVDIQLGAGFSRQSVRMQYLL